jgi:hypothetical protein
MEDWIMDDDYSEEAVNERDPAYEPATSDEDTVSSITWTPAEKRTWQAMKAIRPLLACLEE